MTCDFFQAPQKKLGFPPSSIYIGVTNLFYQLIHCNKYREDNQLVGGVSIFLGSGLGTKKKQGRSVMSY